MNSFSVNELLTLANLKTAKNETFFDEIFFDSRNIVQDENGVFFCLEKNEIKAKSHIIQAYERNIRIVVSQFELILEDLILIKVENPLVFLQKFAQIHLQKFPELNKIGITGSNGKTIVKEWIFQCLQDDFSIVRSPKSYNSQIGLPISVLETKKNHQIGLFECGISQKNEMINLEHILKPSFGILTNIGRAHLENFNSVEELIKEKINLFENSDKIIYNSDNKLVNELIQTKFHSKKLITFGFNESATLQILHQENTKLTLKYDEKIIDLNVLFQDEASIVNQLICILVMFEFNFSIEKIQEKLNQLETIEMRLEVKNGINNSIILNDTFNADINSIKIALQKLQHQNQTKKIVFITDIFESERSEIDLYKKIFKLLNKNDIHKVICIGKIIKKYVYFSEIPFEIFNSTEELIQHFNKNEIQDAAILIKGSRKFKLENFVKTIEKQSHDTILEIDLNALIENIKVFKENLDSTTKIMAMVKANSYGNGSFEIAEFLQHHKIDYLGVAYADEGAKLRENGIYLPIMVMNPEQNSYSTIIDYKLEPEIYSLRVLKLFLAKLKEKTFTKEYSIHLKIDSGMKRLGFEKNDLNELILELKQHSNLHIKSIFTHLASTDENDREFTDFQINVFEKMYDSISESIGYKPIKHALNSHGIIHFPNYKFDMIRIGIGMYGFSSDEKIQLKLKNVQNLKTKISQIKTVLKGESVGYNRRFKAEKEIKIATLPIGYADGISRKLGNGKFYVLINDQKAFTVGSICMDMMMVNIENILCNEGDEVIVYGDEPSIDSIAKICETISYEILTSISNRVKRIFIKN